MLSCSGVKVPWPGVRGAEGQGKRKGVLARGRLKEAWNERAGRGTRTGYEVWYSRGERARDRQVSAKALKALKQEVRQRTGRTRGVSLQRVVDDLRQYLDGWYAYFGVTEVQSPFKELDSWVRRRLRCYVWKQWGRRRYRELRKRGVSQDLAWNTCKSAHGPWRLSRSPARAIALPGQHFDRVGVPRLYQRSRR